MTWAGLAIRPRFGLTLGREFFLIATLAARSLSPHSGGKNASKIRSNFSTSCPSLLQVRARQDRGQGCHVGVGGGQSRFNYRPDKCPHVPAPFFARLLPLKLPFFSAHVRICSKLVGTTGLPHLEHSQWLQNIFPIHIVRQFAGFDWQPAVIAFEARYSPSAATRALWPTTRFLSGQHASWIAVPLGLLALPCLSAAKLPELPADDAGPGPGGIISSLRLMLPSYLDERVPTVAEIAEMAGTSTRSLQRKLSEAGVTYSAGDQSSRRGWIALFPRHGCR